MMNTAAASDNSLHDDNHNSENRFSIANAAIGSNKSTTKRVTTHQYIIVDRQPLRPSQQRAVRYNNHEHHKIYQHMTSPLSMQTINSNKAKNRTEKEEEIEDFDERNLLIRRRLHRIKRRLFLQLIAPSISPTLSTSNSLSSLSASSCCSTTSLVLTVE